MVETMFTSFSHQFSPSILLHIFLHTSVLIVPGAVRVVAISLSFQSSTLLFINLSNKFRYSFAFENVTFWNALPGEICVYPSLASLKKQLKTYLYTKAYPPYSLNHPPAFSVVLTSFLSLDTEIV